MVRLRFELDEEMAAIADSGELEVDLARWSDKTKHKRVIQYLAADAEHLEFVLRKKIYTHLQLIADFYEEYGHVENINIEQLVNNPYAFEPKKAVKPIEDGVLADREERARFVRIGLIQWKNFLEDLYQLIPFGKITSKYMELTLALYDIASTPSRMPGAGPAELSAPVVKTKIGGPGQPARETQNSPVIQEDETIGLRLDANIVNINLEDLPTVKLGAGTPSNRPLPKRRRIEPPKNGGLHGEH